MLEVIAVDTKGNIHIMGHIVLTGKIYYVSDETYEIDSIHIRDRKNKASVMIKTSLNTPYVLAGGSSIDLEVEVDSFGNN